MMVSVHFSQAFTLTLKSLLLRWCLREISYLLGHGLKGASSLILMFPTWHEELLFSSKWKAEKLVMQTKTKDNKGPCFVVHQCVIDLLCPALK